MARFRRLAAFALCLALLAGCGGEAASSASSQAASSASSASTSGAASVPQQSAGAPTALVLGYTPSAGFNPYASSSNLVEQNAGLLFECLVELTPERMSVTHLSGHPVHLQLEHVVYTLSQGGQRQAVSDGGVQ